LTRLSWRRKLLDGGAEWVVRLLAIVAVAAVWDAASLAAIITWPAFGHSCVLQPLPWGACILAGAREFYEDAGGANSTHIVALAESIREGPSPWGSCFA